MSNGFRRENLNWVIRQRAEQLAAQLSAQRGNLFSSDAYKAMRKITSGEAAALLGGSNDSYLRKQHLADGHAARVSRSAKGGAGRTCLERVDLRTAEPSLSGIPPGLVMSVCQEIQTYAEENTRHWHHLVRTDDLVRPMIMALIRKAA